MKRDAMTRADGYRIEATLWFLGVITQHAWRFYFCLASLAFIVTGAVVEALVTARSKP